MQNQLILEDRSQLFKVPIFVLWIDSLAFPSFCEAGEVTCQLEVRGTLTAERKKAATIALAILPHPEESDK